MKSIKSWSTILFLLFPFLLFMGCGGGSGGMGQVSVSLTDASGPWESVWVTVKEVDVHCDGGGWQTVATVNKTLNLLNLTNGVRVGLGLVDVPVDHCSQVRLILDPDTASVGLNELFQLHTAPNYAIDTSHTICPLALSSEDKTGIKLNHEFDVTTARTDIVLDFDASKSIVVEGNGTCRLKPVINISSTVEQANVSGTVVSGAVALPGAQVSAQIPNPLPTNPFVIQGIPAITAADGSYKLLLAPGSYNIVAYKQDYTLDTLGVSLASGDDKILDPLSLDLVTYGTVTGKIQITNSDANTFATLSFRSLVEGQIVEVTSVNVQNGFSLPIPFLLPPGTYTVEVFSFDQGIQAPVHTELANVVVNSNGTTDLGIISLP